MKFFDWWLDHPFVLVVVIVLLIFGSAIGAAVCDYHIDRRGLYQAWCRAHNNELITYEEWNNLRHAGLLPVTRP